MIAPAHALRIPSLLSDGMVLPANRRLRLWGWADSGAQVRVTCAGWHAVAIAAPDGGWEVWLNPLPASAEPQSITIRSGEQTVVIRDVLVGMVLLVSGQSNMAFSADNDAEFTMMRADPACRLLRHFTVAKNRSDHERLDVNGSWRSGEGEALGSCSAVGAWAALAIIRSTQMPVGIISVAWGGTAIACWLDDATHSSTDAPDQRSAEQVSSDLARYAADVLAYETGLDGRLRDPCWHDPEPGPLLDEAGHPAWKPSADPFTALPAGRRASDVVWYRCTTTPPSADVGRSWRIDLGLIDAEWILWVDGVEVARADRRLPCFWLHGCRGTAIAQGQEMRIVIRCCYRMSAGTRYGRIEDIGLVRDDGRRQALGPWEERIEQVSPAPDQHAPRPWFAGQVPWGLGQPVTAFRAMIAPLSRYAIDGIMWYQGESDVAAHDRYAKRLQGLIRSWRTRWADPKLPMAIVQLAGFHHPPAQPGGEKIPELRQVQQEVSASEARVGLISAIDGGDPEDIHPRCKRALGERLGHWALANVGGADVPWRHPQIVAVERRPDVIHLTVANAVGPLAVHPPEVQDRLFDLTQGDGSPRWCGFTVAGHCLEVRLPDAGGPVRLRCCWQDHPHGFIRDTRGMPLLPFSITV